MNNYFKEIKDLVLRVEGQYQDDIDDNGNRYGGVLIGTKYGITPATLRRHRGQKVTRKDMEELTKQEAIAIYKSMYWDAMRCGEINNFNIALLLFDAYVNHGTRGSKMLQKAVNSVLKRKVLKIDGVIGPNSLAAINYTDSVALWYEYKKNRAIEYRRIVTHNPKKKKFFKGWINRLESYCFDVKRALL